MDVHLEIKSVSKSFGNIDALKDVSLKVERGSFVCLLGPSGCGKTTLLRIIAGFDHATSGQLLLDGEDISAVPPHKRDFGMVFQSLALFPHMTVADNIAYGLKLRGITGAKQRDRVEELLSVIHLPTIADRPVSALSGGQRQRVAMARALAVQPKVFLLDEPLSALDAKLRDSMQIELRQLQQQFGVTTVLVTHDQTEAMMLADQLVILNKGEIQQAASPSALYAQPASAFVADFLGASNILPGKSTANGRVELFGVETGITTSTAAGTVLDVSIRSEDINLEPAKGIVGRTVGTVEFLRDLGPASEVIVSVGGSRVRVHSSLPEVTSMLPGQEVEFDINVQKCMTFVNAGGGA
jgi:putative spermidine/putrescine transport system ATP-binding protein